MKSKNFQIDRYKNTGNAVAAFEKMAKHQTLWNGLYDRGHGELDEEKIEKDDDEQIEENDENIPPIN